MPTPFLQLSRADAHDLVEARLTDPLFQQNTAQSLREVLHDIIESAYWKGDDTLNDGPATPGPTPTTPAAPTDLTVNTQRLARWTPATGTSGTDYEYEFTPAAPAGVSVSAQRQVSITTAAGETAADYEYQF